MKLYELELRKQSPFNVYINFNFLLQYFKEGNILYKTVLLTFYFLKNFKNISGNSSGKAKSWLGFCIASWPPSKQENIKLTLDGDIYFNLIFIFFINESKYN